MNIKPVLAELVYDFEEYYGTKRKGYSFKLKNVIVNKNSLDQISEKVWQSKSHYRELSEEGKFSQVIFKYNGNKTDVSNFRVSIVYLDCNRKSEVILKYNKKFQIWYEESLFLDQKGNEFFNVPGAAPAGITGSGIYTVRIYDSKKKINEYTINVIPNSLTISDYKKILDDLVFMHDELILASNSKHQVGINDTSKVDYLIKIIERLKWQIKLIVKNPKVKLSKKIKKVSKRSINKYNGRIIRELIKNQHSDKIRIYVDVESHNIYENQIIKYYLSRTQYTLLHYQKALKVKEENIRNNKEYLDAIERSNLEEFLIKKIEYKIKKTNNQLNKMNKENKKSEYAINLCKEILEDVFFDSITLRDNMFLKPTQIFTKDKKYSIIWKLLKDLDDVTIQSIDLSRSDIFIKDIHKIYEYWVFFKMTYQLFKDQKWKIVNYSNFKTLINKMLFNEGQNINGLYASFSHDLNSRNSNRSRKIKLKIYFNETHTINSKKRRPDFTFEFTKDGKVETVFLDAKLRNYSEQSISVLNDIQDTSIDKYIKDFSNSKVNVKASFIVHNDNSDKNTLFGGRKVKDIYPKHKYGAFSLTVDKYDNFKKFMKMIMEFHLKEYWTCWECGESKNIQIEVKQTEGGNDKFHCKCYSCKEFWVKTHCYNCKGHALIKHFENYHIVKSGNIWYVNCPFGC